MASVGDGKQFCVPGMPSERGEQRGVRTESLLGARLGVLCTLGTLFPSHTSRHCLPFHTQHEHQGWLWEVFPSPQARRGTGHFALRVHSLCTRLVYSGASIRSCQRTARGSCHMQLLTRQVWRWPRDSAFLTSAREVPPLLCELGHQWVARP